MVGGEEEVWSCEEGSYAEEDDGGDAEHAYEDGYGSAGAVDVDFRWVGGR